MHIEETIKKEGGHLHYVIRNFLQNAYNNDNNFNYESSSMDTFFVTMVEICHDKWLAANAAYKFNVISYKLHSVFHKKLYLAV